MAYMFIMASMATKISTDAQMVVGEVIVPNNTLSGVNIFIVEILIFLNQQIKNIIIALIII